jgi:hypothetical protein
LVARLALRLRGGSGERRPTNEDITTDADRDLVTFARHQIAAQGPIEGVDLASPLSISVDLASGAVRIEVARTADRGPAAPSAEVGLLEVLTRQIGPALLVDGRIARIEVGLVTLGVGDGDAAPGAAETEWAVVRPGAEQPC